MQGKAVRSARLAPAVLAIAIASRAVASCSASPALACAALPAASTGCPSLDGLTSFCTWADWGCARETPCGGYFVLRDEGTDARFTYYYSATTGAFVATVEESAGGGGALCLAGPASFQPPSDCDLDTLADCDPPPRDGGLGPAGDAAPDAPFSAPAPSGSPSSQPLKHGS